MTLRLLAAAMLALALTACGFHLRGSVQPVDEALNPVVVLGVSAGSALLPPLRRSLADSGADIVASAAAATSVLRITEDTWGERVTAVSAQGRPRELELSYRVTFELHGPSGVLIESRTVTLAREFAVDERDVLGKAREAEVLRAGLVRDMVATIVRQVAAVRSE